MTLEEIEARWKAATPGPWRWDVDRGALWPTDWCVSDQDTPSDDDARAFASAPTDIAYLLDRVRELASDNRSLRERLRDEHGVHNASMIRVLDDLAKYRRAHAWFVERMHIGDRGGWNPCGGDIHCEHSVCEYAKARDLTL